MKRTVKLTESDLARIVKRVIKEQSAPSGSMQNPYTGVSGSEVGDPDLGIHREGNLEDFLEKFPNEKNGRFETSETPQPDGGRYVSLRMTRSNGQTYDMGVMIGPKG